MRYTLPAIAISAVALTAAAAIGAPQMGKPSADVKAAVAASTRTPANLARDKYRHPAETLAFFGVKPSHTVVELVAESGRLLGLEMTEINPILDERNRTARAAVEFCESALGKRVL